MKFNNFGSTVAQKAGEVSAEVRQSVKTAVLARKIEKELDDGAALEDILFERVPSLNAQTVMEDARLLTDGIRSVSDAMEQNVDVQWVRQQLDSAMSNLNDKQRVAYLSNVISAVAAAYPNIELDEESARKLEDIKNAETNNSGDVAVLLDMIGAVLPKVGVLLQRASVSGVMKCMRKIDTEKVLDGVGSGANYVTAYAAARYVLQKYGEFGSRKEAQMPAFTVGATAAATVESSKLMALYTSGKLGLETLQEKLAKLYTVVATFICKNAIHFLSVIAQVTLIAVVGHTIFTLFAHLYLWLFVDVFVLLIGSYVLGALLVNKTLPIAKVEEVIQWVWERMKDIWTALRDTWRQLTGREPAETADAEQAEAAQADTAETEAAQVDTAETEAAQEGTAEAEENNEAEENDEQETESSPDFSGIFA